MPYGLERCGLYEFILENCSVITMLMHIKCIVKPEAFIGLDAHLFMEALIKVRFLEVVWPQW
jgi:hypothetical protein